MSIEVPPFPGTNHFIPLGQAIDMTTKYRKDKEQILDPEIRDEGILPLSETFNRDAFDSLLAQEGCEGIRLYYSMDDKQRLHIIAVGVNSRNEDMIPNNEAIIVETAVRCPAQCPPESVLNS